jgi:hypothetical protein
MVSLAQGKNGFGGVKVRSKKADEPAHLDELAFCFAHAALHRWLMFSIRTGVTALAQALGGIGGSIDVPPEERGDIYFDAASNAPQWRSIDTAKTWVLERLKDQGVQMVA